MSVPTSSSWRILIPKLPSMLSPFTKWLVSGSCALAHHGMELSPNDIDLWFEPDELERFAHASGLVVESRVYPGYRTDGITLDCEEWQVDCVGRVVLDTGLILQVDRDMLNAASGHPPIEASADIISELLAMNRPFPKSDWERAKILIRSSDNLAFDLIRARLHIFGMVPTHINEALNFLRE